jgi:hypothetical protein
MPETEKVLEFLSLEGDRKVMTSLAIPDDLSMCLWAIVPWS